MTKWTEIPLRPQGQPWPGLNTRGGRLDPGQGQLEDGSFNAIINEADILSKRKGLIRGIDERFDGVVCGLFRYTDECGVEHIVVADEDGIKVRTPFDIPTFLGSDSLPFDDFNTLDTTRWTNTADYQVFVGALQLNASAASNSNEFVAESRFMQWFKAAAPTSYFTEIQYRLVAAGVQQVVAVVLKRTGTTYLIANVVSSSSEYKATLQLVQSGSRTTLAEQALGGASIADGFLRLTYNADTLTATLRVIPSGGTQVSLTSVLTELQASGLGQNTAVGISRASDIEAEAEIASVSSGAA